jgi:hypothetical protein
MMIEIPYTAKNLAECIIFQDIIKFPHLQDRAQRAELAKKSLSLIARSQSFLGCFNRIRIGDDDGYVFNSLKSELVARLASRNIKANYGIKQSDRQTIIANAITLFKEGTPFDVYRFDIKKFYENVDLKILFERLMLDGKCSWQTLVLVDQFFKTLSVSGVSGLPRGLSISATLSEFYLKEFDLAISSMSEVFYYARFVDDILIIASGSSSKADFERKVEEYLPQGLEFHGGGKREYIPVARLTQGSGKVLKKFDYLGYGLQIFNEASHETVNGIQRRKVVCDISDGKVAKIKMRLLQSYTSYLSSYQYPSDFLLLKNRIRALAGNFYIADPMTGVDIKTGIYFNYIHKNSIGRCALDELDSFSRGVLFSSKHKLSRRISAALSLSKRKQLAGFSFRSGFEKARFHSFKYDVLKKIKECWRK